MMIILALASAPASADPMLSMDAPWAKAMKATKDANFDACFVRKVNEKCETYVAGIEQARTLAKGHAGVEHILLPNLYEVRTRAVYTQMNSGKLDAALATASSGLRTAETHFEKGKHFHAVTESLALRVAYGKALVKAGKYAEAEAQFGTAVEIAEVVYASASKAAETPKFESPAYKVWREAMRYGADASLDWADLMLIQDGEKKTPAVSAKVADNIGRALTYLELAERRKLIWVDTQALRSDKIASLAELRATMLADLGRFKEARVQLGWADSLLAPQAVGDDYYSKRVRDWRSTLKSTNARICKQGASKVAQEQGMLSC